MLQKTKLKERPFESVKKIMKNWFKRNKHFGISALIVTFILLLIYAIKGIYPFGNLTIANGDMGQSYMPYYYFLYDVFKEGKSILYDYTLGLGSNIYGAFMVDGLLNPSVFLIFLNTRENIPYMFSFVMIAKMAFIAFTSYLLFNKMYKENKFYNVIFSVLYALSGFTLTYNTNIMWLDVVGLFPLFILATDYMFRTNKIHWYAIVLALMLIFNYNLAYMVLMFIIFVIPIYIRFGLEKEDRKKAIFNLIIGTILSVGLSAFSFIPSFMQVMTSYRFSGAITNAVTNKNILYKMVVFIFYSLPLYGYIKWFKYRKEDKKYFLIYNLALLFSAVIPIIFERVNLLWHTGSYQVFPFRYGFIPLLILYMGALRYFAIYNLKENEDKNIPKTINVLNYTLYIVIICFGIAVSYIININQPAFLMNIQIFVLIFIICVFSIIITMYDKKKKIIISSICLFQVLIYTYAYIGVPVKYRGGIEWSDEQIFFSNELNNKFKEIDRENKLYRIKDLAIKTTENCALSYNIPSISTFLHIISKEQVLTNDQLGYSHDKTKIGEYGGTIFSDAIYGIKYVLTKNELPSEIYTYIDNIEDVKLYEYNKNLPIGILYDKQITDIPEEIRDFDAQNYLYKNLFNKNEDIINVISDYKFENNEEEYKYSINVDSKSELYMYIDNEGKNLISNIEVNGKEINLPVLNNLENKAYPILRCNGILDLGYFENQEVEIKFKSLNKIESKDFKIGLLDIEKYNKLLDENQNKIDITVEKNKINIKGEALEKSNLFIPINYDNGWKIVNSNKNVNRIYGNYMGIELEEGNNEIQLEFKPYLFKESVIITLVTIGIMTISYFIQKKYDIRNVKFIVYIVYGIGILIYVVAIYKFYISTIFQTIIDIFK